MIQYYKNSDEQWIEDKRYESGRGYYIVDGQLYFRSNNSLIPLNMDFESKTCGACYQVSNIIQGKKKITGNEILFTCKVNNKSLSLHEQSYSDNTCFYTLKDKLGNWNVRYGNHSINELIKEIERDIKINSEYQEKYPQEIYNLFKQWYEDVLNNLKKIA